MWRHTVGAWGYLLVLHLCIVSFEEVLSLRPLTTSPPHIAPTIALQYIPLETCRGHNRLNWWPIKVDLTTCEIWKFTGRSAPFDGTLDPAPTHPVLSFKLSIIIFDFWLQKGLQSSQESSSNYCCTYMPWYDRITHTWEIFFISLNTKVSSSLADPGGVASACPLRVQILSFRHTNLQNVAASGVGTPLWGWRLHGKSWIHHCSCHFISVRVWISLFHSIICLSASMLSRNTFPDLLDIVGNTEIAIALAICLLFYISLIISGHIWLVSGIILSFLEQCFLTAPCFRILGALVWFLDVKVDGSQLCLSGFKFIWCAWTDYLMWEHAEWSFLPQQQITNTYWHIHGANKPNNQTVRAIYIS